MKFLGVLRALSRCRGHTGPAEYRLMESRVLGEVRTLGAEEPPHALALLISPGSFSPACGGVRRSCPSYVTV